MGPNSLFCYRMASDSVSSDARNENSNMKKCLDLPGFSSDIVMVSTRSLKRDFNWSSEDLKWLNKNWIQLDKASKDGDKIFVKPYEHKKGPLKNSHEDYDTLSLQEILKKRRSRTSTKDSD